MEEYSSPHWKRENNPLLHRPRVSTCCQGVFHLLSCLHLIPLGWSVCSLFQPQPLLLSCQFVNSFCGPSHTTLFSSSCVGSLVGFWISILMEMHDKVSWILNLDTILFPGFSLLRAPSSAIPFSFQPFPPLTHMDASRTSIFLPRDIYASTYSYMTFHSLTSVAEIPWVRKPEMFPWLLRLILARHTEQGVRDHAEFLPDSRSPLRAMPWEGGLPTVLGAIPMGWHHWRLSVHPSVPSVFRQDTGLMETKFQVKGVDRTPFSDLWSKPGLSKLYKELFLAKFLISHMCEMETSLCQKYTPPPPPQLCL